MCVIDHHDMTLAVEVPLNPYTINQSISQSINQSINQSIYPVLNPLPDDKKIVPLYTSNFISLNAFLMYPKSYFLCPLYYVSHETVNPFPNKPRFLRVCRTKVLKTLWGKEKLLVTSNFSFSHSVFYPIRELSAIYIKFKIVVCLLFQFGRV